MKVDNDYWYVKSVRDGNNANWKIVRTTARHDR